MGFFQAVSTCFGKYADFQGRASRAELWWFQLFQIIVSFVLAIVGMVVALAANMNMLVVLEGLLGLYGLAVVLPCLGVEVRRLHDLGYSGWWMVTALVPYLGVVAVIVLLVQFCKRGTLGDNRFGHAPLA
jgi:uncharacterized membrane protein YhaH (DUF805 family)